MFKPTLNYPGLLGRKVEKVGSRCTSQGLGWRVGRGVRDLGDTTLLKRGRFNRQSVDPGVGRFCKFCRIVSVNGDPKRNTDDTTASDDSGHRKHHPLLLLSHSTPTPVLRGSSSHPLVHPNSHTHTRTYTYTHAYTCLRARVVRVGRLEVGQIFP